MSEIVGLISKVWDQVEHQFQVNRATLSYQPFSCWKKTKGSSGTQKVDLKCIPLYIRRTDERNFSRETGVLARLFGLRGWKIKMQSTAETMKHGVKSVLEPLHNTITPPRVRPSSKAVFFIRFIFLFYDYSTQEQSYPFPPCQQWKPSGCTMRSICRAGAQSHFPGALKFLLPRACEQQRRAKKKKLSTVLRWLQ